MRFVLASVEADPALGGRGVWGRMSRANTENREAGKQVAAGLSPSLYFSWRHSEKRLNIEIAKNLSPALI